MRVIIGLVDVCTVWRLAHPDKGSDAFVSETRV
jgi:hypothetical protein